MKQGWEIKKLGEVCNIIGGGTPSKKNSEFYNGNIYWATVRDMKSSSISDTEFKITDEAVAQSSTNIVPRGNVIIATRVGLGKVCVNENDTAINQDLRGIIPKQIIQLDNNYLFHWFKSISHLIVAEGKGATVQGVTLPYIKNIEIPLPPLSEQQRIVSILDKVFAAIDKAKANAEQNLKNAYEVFDSYLQEIFDKKDESWNVRSLKELTTKIGSGATPRGGRESYKKEGISLVRSMNVHDWEFKNEKLAYIDNKQAKELEGVTLQENDVLLNITGASVARCCIIPKKYLPARVNQHVSIIRPKKDVLDANFLNLLLTSKHYKDQLLFIGEQGSTRQAITKAQIEAFKIIFPDYKQQQSIVNKLDALRAETQKLEAIYKKKLDCLEELKKSVLQKAFAGELIEDV